jgi:hypothetical protein
MGRHLNVGYICRQYEGQYLHLCKSQTAVDSHFADCVRLNFKSGMCLKGIVQRKLTAVKNKLER